MTNDDQGAFERPPQILVEVLKALLNFRQQLASQLLTLSIDLAPPHADIHTHQVHAGLPVLRNAFCA